jgi:hypothetical protein
MRGWGGPAFQVTTPGTENHRPARRVVGPTGSTRCHGVGIALSRLADSVDAFEDHARPARRNGARVRDRTAIAREASRLKQSSCANSMVSHGWRPQSELT